MSKLILILLFPLLSWAQLDAPYEAILPLTNKDRNFGDVKAMIKGDDVISVDKKSLIEILNQNLNEDTINSLKKLPDDIKPELLPFSLRLNAQEYKIETNIGTTIQRNEQIKIRNDLKNDYPNALPPSPFGGALNYRLEQTYGHEKLGGNSFNGQFSPFINLKSFVFENQTFYQSNTQDKWFRGDTRVVKDFEKYEVRSQIGDIYPQLQGFMVGRGIGGINIHRNFSLNPYRLPFPTGSQNFTLKSRSLVKYYVNNILVKTEYLTAGNYTAKDIPLNNGLNTIMVEATDDMGQKQVFVFKSATSINLLNEGESRFDISYGTTFVDNNFLRTYSEKDGKLFSGFYQYGIRADFSSSLYLQNQTTHSLLGAEIIKATSFGNFSMGHAESVLIKSKGQGNSLGYQYISQGQKWYQAHTLSLRFENKSQEFKTTKFDTTSAIKNNYSANYTLPLTNLMTFSVGANYGEVRDKSLSNRFGYDSTVNLRIFGRHNLSIFTGRTRDEYKKWNTVAFLFLTITFPETNNFLSTLYDDVQKSTRVTYLKDNQNKLYRTRSQTTLEDTKTTQNGEADLFYPTPYGDIGTRVNANRPKEDRHTIGKASVRFNSAIVFAYENDKWAGGLSRSIPGSFVIFKPEKSLKNQKIKLKSTSPYTEAESGLFKEITYSNLLAYQYRDVMLDPSLMDIGRSLTQEKFTLYPTYRSAHLIELTEKGSVILKGKLVNENGVPIDLKVGHIGDVPFFTNRKGEFFIEGIEPGKYQIEIEEYSHKSTLTIQKDGQGIIDLGTIIFKDDP